MQVVAWLVGALSWIAFVVLLAALARRILGVPVGWTRAVVFGLVLVGVTSPILVFIADRSGLLAGNRVVGNPAVAGLVGFLAVAWTFTLGLAGLVIAAVLLGAESIFVRVDFCQTSWVRSSLL